MVLFKIKDVVYLNTCKTIETEGGKEREMRRHRSSEGLVVELEPSMTMLVML